MTNMLPGYYQTPSTKNIKKHIITHIFYTTKLQIRYATSEAPGFLGPGARGPEPHRSRPLNRPCPRWPLCRWTRWQQRPGRCSESAQHLSVLRYLRLHGG